MGSNTGMYIKETIWLIGNTCSGSGHVWSFRKHTRELKLQVLGILAHGKLVDWQVDALHAPASLKKISWPGLCKTALQIFGPMSHWFGWAHRWWHSAPGWMSERQLEKRDRRPEYLARRAQWFILCSHIDIPLSQHGASPGRDFESFPQQLQQQDIHGVFTIDKDTDSCFHTTTLVGCALTFAAGWGMRPLVVVVISQSAKRIPSGADHPRALWASARKRSCKRWKTDGDGRRWCLAIT